ncbi:hypothetical protein AB9F42_34305, partial [Rhizobium leguminosarum]
MHPLVGADIFRSAPAGALDGMILVELVLGLGKRLVDGDFVPEFFGVGLVSLEIFVYQQAMEEVGHTVHIVCPDKKAGDILRTSLHDFE